MCSGVIMCVRMCSGSLCVRMSDQVCTDVIMCVRVWDHVCVDIQWLSVRADVRSCVFGCDRACAGV